MKFKEDFVTNSSSTAFIITNTSNVKKTLVDFVKENPDIIEDFTEWYKIDEKEYTQKALLKSAKKNNLVFNPGESSVAVFGDEQDTLIGEVFDYMLRDGGSSESFRWRLDEYLR